MSGRARYALAAALLLAPLPAEAVQPGEVMKDPALEHRAREISEGLRCLVCQNQSIDDSDAPLAKDLRLLVRDRLAKGDSNQAVRDYIVARYGEFVLLRPVFALHTLLLWLTPALGFDAARGSVRLYGDGTRPVSWVSARDVARAAAAAVTQKAARNVVVEFGGLQALSPRDVVRMFETAGAGAIATESVPEAALRAQMDSATDALQQSFAGLMLQLAAGDAIDPATRNRLFTFPMTSVDDFISTAVAPARP